MVCLRVNINGRSSFCNSKAPKGLRGGKKEIQIERLAKTGEDEERGRVRDRQTEREEKGK